jgi:aspartyl-tRNA(Asn)/glutamyl-tRNA(Gln) amidotransferase subunit B
MDRSIAYEIERQSRILSEGGTVDQETLGWSEARGATYSQRSKEDAHDYRYFPEPDLPPLVLEDGWVDHLSKGLPELPHARLVRFMSQYGLNDYNAWRLTSDRELADYFEKVVAQRSSTVVVADPKLVANWMLGDLFSLMNQAGITIDRLQVAPGALAQLVTMVSDGQINQSSAKEVLIEMFSSGRSPADIVEARGLTQVSDESFISDLVRQALSENPKEVASYKAGKVGIANFLFGQVMKKAAGKANPQVVRAELERQLLQ